MLASGDFVGMGIVRYFDGVPVRGIVTEYLPGEPFDLWHCRHEDGDEEDLEQYEVVQATRDYRISVRGMKLSNTIPSSKGSKLSTLEMKNLLLDHGWYIDAKANSHYSYHTPDGTQTFTSLASAMRRFYQDGGVAAEEVSMIEQDRDEMEIEEKVEEKEVEEKTPDDVQTEQKEEEKVDPWVSFEQSFLEEEVEEEKKTNDDTVVEENVKVVTMSKRVLDVLVSVRASEKLTVSKLCEEASELRRYTIKDWMDTLKFLVMEEEES